MQSNRPVHVRERLLAVVLFAALVAVAASFSMLDLVPTGLGMLVPALAAAGLWLGLFVLAHRHGTHHGLLVAGVLWVLQIGLGVGALRIAALAFALDQHTLGACSRILVPAALLGTCVISLICAVLDHYELEPSPAAKISLGFVALALACTSLATGIEWARNGGVIASAATITCVAALMFAHALSGPDCVRMLLDCLPAHTRIAGLASSLLTLSCTQSIAASLTLPRSPDSAFTGCLTLGFAALATAVLGSFIWRPMTVLTYARPHDDDRSDLLVGQPTPSLDPTF